jgi:hypothetical protein
MQAVSEVLVGRRRDPPWTFPAERIKVGESPDYAAAWEETEHRTRATGIIGGGIQSVTEGQIVYMTAMPAFDTDTAACSGELDEARRISLTEAKELISDISCAVHLRVASSTQLGRVGHPVLVVPVSASTGIASQTGQLSCQRAIVSVMLLTGAPARADSVAEPAG